MTHLALTERNWDAAAKLRHLPYFILFFGVLFKVEKPNQIEPIKGNETQSEATKK